MRPGSSTRSAAFALAAGLALLSFGLAGCSVLLDWDDPAEQGEICGNGIDDDGDGNTDCEDPLCANAAYCQQRCGDGRCTPPENHSNCAQDCAAIGCGDGICSQNESFSLCQQDCYCGNGTCDVDENHNACAQDCAGTGCGDGVCAAGETAANCLADCHCGNGVCNSQSPYSETPSNCPSDCEQAPSCPSPYGVFSSFFFSTPFILANAQLGDDAYIQAHENAFLTTPAFIGTWQSSQVSLPPPNASSTWVWAGRVASNGADPAYIYILQRSYDAADAQVDPSVQIYFDDDAVTTGSKAVGLYDTDQARLILVGASDCIAGFAVGTFTVDAASNTTSTDGGSLTISAASLQLYHPTRTPYDPPYDDLTDWYTSNGTTICPCQ
jgi:hypothetical protein